MSGARKVEKRERDMKKGLEQRSHPTPTFERKKDKPPSPFLRRDGRIISPEEERSSGERGRGSSLLKQPRLDSDRI